MNKKKIEYKCFCLICGKQMMVKGTATDFEVCKCNIDDLEEFNRKLGTIK